MTYLAAALAVAIACAVALFTLWNAADDRAERAEAALIAGDTNEKIVTKYVDRIVRVPGPAVIRDRLVRGLCPAAGVPGAGRAHDAAGANPGAGPPDGAGNAGRLAADIGACQRNRLKLEALQAALQDQIQ